uniref:Uncharacterized protein n=1 Tax=Arundo donax TaxID=35708 RepID=A0A0A9F3R3_ARUDO
MLTVCATLIGSISSMFCQCHIMVLRRVLASGCRLSQSPSMMVPLLSHSRSPCDLYPGTPLCCSRFKLRSCCFVHSC